MNRTAKIITVLGLCLAVALGILYGKGLLSVHEGLDPPASLAALKLQNPPKPAPDVAFYDAAGGRHTLAEYRGRYVLMNFWATWCAPCVAELPALAKLKVRVPGMVLLAVNLDRTKVDAGAFLKGHQAAPLGVLTDTDSVMMKTFLLIGMPTTLLIDPKGNVVARAEGPAEWATPEAVKYFKRITGS
jgi:thiol-disulfide isomerase/thioredoxin